MPHIGISKVELSTPKIELYLKMTLGQGHDATLGHKQSVCEVRISIVSP